MPVFESTPTLSSRGRAFSRAQLPLLLGMIFVTAEGLWALPDVATSESALVGVAVIAVASVLFLSVPWRWWSSWSMMALAVADIVGVAFLRLAYFDHLPSVGMLAVFPVVWLAYAFARWVIAVAVAGAGFITLLPFLVNGPLPTTPIAIASVLTLPVLIMGLAIAVGEAARQLATGQNDLHQANQRLQDSLRKTRDSERLSRTLFEAVEVALAFYDTDDQLVMANTLAEQAVMAAGFRVDQPPYAGAHVRRTDNKTPIPFEDQIIPRALRGDLDNHEMEWIGPVGHQVAIIANAQQVLRADGSLWGTLIAAYDVTDLARSMQTKDEFITTVSHELRTPLTSILGYVELLGDELLDEPDGTGAGGPTPKPDLDLRSMRDMLDRIERGAVNLQTRIQQLLDTADRRRALRLAPTDVALLVDGVASTMSTQARTAGLTLETTTTEPEWATIDPAKIEQALENLVSNAIKYTTSPGRVLITVTGSEDHVDIAVADTGVGMTYDEINQAFDPFWRGQHAHHEAVQGIGIGLGLVRDICDAHHATVTLTSQPGEGTVAAIRLPRRH